MKIHGWYRRHSVIEYNINAAMLCCSMIYVPARLERLALRRCMFMCTQTHTHIVCKIMSIAHAYYLVRGDTYPVPLD